MRKALWITLMTALVAVSGCLDNDGDSGNDGTNPGDLPAAVRYDLPEDPMPEGPDHDHTAPAAHKFLWNYAFGARDPLMQNQAQIAGLHALDLQDNHLFGAVYGANTVAINGGLAIWSLADPANPVMTGRVNIPGAVGGDRSMEATIDGNFVVMGTEPVSCLGQVNPVPIDVYLFDTSNKAQPMIVDVLTSVEKTTAEPGLNPDLTPSVGLGLPGEHSIAVHRIQDRDYAFVFGHIYEIVVDEITGGQLVDTGSKVNVGHDMYVRDTPWGDVWALSANGGGGLQIFNVTDPLNPVEIGIWDLPGRQELKDETGIEYYMHTADVAFFEDQIVVIVSSEDWLDWPSPMWILDGTGLNEVKEGEEAMLLEAIGVWQNPGNHTALGTSFSLHNPRFGEDGILTISSYHGGLWQMDFRHPDLRADPAEIAYAVFAEGEQTLLQDPVHQTIESNLCGLGLALDAPTYMDVELGPEGHMYAADVYMGLYAFAPTEDHPVYGAS